MDRIGFLVNSITEATSNIDFGRKGFATRGKEQEGRILYEKGIAVAMYAFKEAQITADPLTIILAEYTFITQELHFCHETDKASITSLTKAIRFFDDAFIALKIVEKKEQYQIADKTYPHDKDYRISGFPIDSYHIACKSHKTRLQNFMKTPGIDLIEKDLLNQRFANLSTAQNGYVGLQRKALLELVESF